MINLTLTATVDLIDIDKYKKAVQDEMRRVFMKAGQKFLLAAIPRIPIWAGMARGAFRNAEDLFGKVTNDKQSGGVRIRTTRKAGQGRGGGEKITSQYRRGYYYTPPGGSPIERTPQAGRQFATKTVDIIDSSLSKGKTTFYFRYKIDITYFTKFDQKWGAFKAGAAALEAYIRDNINLPDPLKFKTRKTITSK